MGMIQYMKEEFAVIKERDPAIKSPMEVLLYPTFHVMLSYRRAHRLYLKGHYFWARFISQRAARKTGIEIHPGATIGKGFFIDHGSGVIIGETAIVGDNVTLYQGVTLGGTGKETGKRHPTIGDNVMISAGAKIIGSFTVGENSKIGAGSVICPIRSKKTLPYCSMRMRSLSTVCSIWNRPCGRLTRMRSREEQAENIRKNGEYQSGEQV